MSLWAWLLLTFSIGVCVGVVLDDAWEMIVDLRKRRKDKPVSSENTDKKRRDHTGYLGWIMVVMTVCLAVVTLLFIYTLSRLEDYSRCTANWQQQFGASYKARIDATVPVSKAMDEIVRAVGAKDQAAFDAAVKEYNTVRDQQDRERATNPIPALPNALCGDPIR